MHARPRTLIKLLAWIIVAGVALICGAVVLDRLEAPPRALGPYIERRGTGHNPAIEAAGQWVGRSLLALDRPDPMSVLPRPARFTPPPAPAAKGGQVVFVKSAEEAVQAVEHAEPGDTVTFLPGVYAFSGRKYIDASRPGRPGKEIVVRAQAPGTVQLEFDMVEGFKVSGPYWVFENLGIRGVCKEHSDCEHAFHVVDDAHHFTARGNTLIDFNAQFKINGNGRVAPDHGLLENNIISNGSVRRTSNPVTTIDLVAASHWMVRGNRISDFIKGDGDHISYGGFFKGAGEDNRFERNVVVCEDLLRGQPGSRVGLSLGGGGTGPEFCRDKRCITEQSAGVIQSNLIAACSDNGIYLNKAATSIVRHNTLLDTGTLAVRFPESSADVEGNLIDSGIQARDGGVVRARENLQTAMSSLYVGRHPVRGLFTDAANLDLRWSAGPPRRTTAQSGLPDLCGGERPAQPAYGAAENYGCLAPRH